MNIPKRTASIWLIGLLLLVAACIPASAAPGTLTVSRTAVSFPSTNYGTYSFSIVKQAGTTVPLFCIEPELDSISTTKTYTNQGVLTQAVIDGITWSHNNGTVNGYGKPTANQIYSILWHAVNTEGLTLNNLTNWQQGGIQMAIKHWRQSTAWGVKATAGTDAAKAFDLAKRLQASARTDVKTMQTTRAGVAVSAPTEVMTRSSNTYTIATWRVSGTYDSYSVKLDTSLSTAGIVLSKSGNTIIATLPANKLNGALLSAGEDGIMGVLEIPRIQVMLPIYHGTGDTSLQRGVGHIYGTSLPVGGTGTHTALSGHTGMAGQRMLSDLDQLVLGDTFCLRVWGESLTYEVDQIRVVLPEDVCELAIDPDKDYCTLGSCTPYGINTHRLLVRGIRTEAEYTAADAQPKPESPAPAASTWRRQIGRSILIGLAASAGLWLVVVGISRRRHTVKKDL